MNVITSIGKFAVGIITFSSRLDKAESKMDLIEKNYLSRFEDMSRHITRTKEDIIEHQHAMEIRLLEKIR